MDYTHAAFFNGIGGFQLAADAVGWNNYMSCEIDLFCNKVTKFHFPKCKQEYDIRTTNFNIYRGRIDVLSGGFPCQPYSQSGKRLGKEDNRHLWPQMLRAIQEIQPTWVVGENVLGIVNWSGGLVFEEVQADLETEGYEVQSYVLPAAGVGAPHQRYRVWFVAYSDNDRKNRRTRKDASSDKEERLQERNEIQHPNESNRLRRFTTDSQGPSSRGKHKQQQKQGEFRGQNSGNDATDSPSIRGREILHNLQRRESNGDCVNSNYEQNYWQNFPTEAPICNGDDGLSSQLDAITFPKWRTESIKSGGNAIVPQGAIQIFKSINEFNTIEK